MATTNGLGGFARRLSELEDQALTRTISAEAERIAEMVSAPPDWLLARAAEIAALIERFGLNRTTEIISTRVGLSAEQLEASAARLAPDGI